MGNRERLRGRSRRRALRIIAVVLIVGLFPAMPAHACSCAGGDPRRSLKAADGAIIGEYLGMRPNPLADRYDDRGIYTFDVEESIKGEFGDTLEVYSADNGAACGIEARVGERLGLFLYRQHGHWHSGLCSQIEPWKLRRAAEPLPPPNGEGPARFLVGGSFGKARTIALDSHGRTLAYGYGRHETIHISLCPGGGRFAEIVSRHPGRDLLAIRRTSTMEILRRVELPYGGPNYQGFDTKSLSCRNREASNVLVFGSTDSATARSDLSEVRGTEVTTLHQGTGRTATFGVNRLWMPSWRRGRRIVSLDLDTLEKQQVARVGSYPGELALSPNRKKLTTYAGAYTEETRPKLFVIANLGSSPTVRSTRLSDRSPDRHIVSGETEWWGNRRVVFLPGGGDDDTARVYKSSLHRLVARFEYYAGESVIVGDRALGLNWGPLVKARLPNGPTGILRRRFPSSLTFELVAVPRR